MWVTVDMGISIGVWEAVCTITLTPIDAVFLHRCRILSLSLSFLLSFCLSVLLSLALPVSLSHSLSFFFCYSVSLFLCLDCFLFLFLWSEAVGEDELATDDREGVVKCDNTYMMRNELRTTQVVLRTGGAAASGMGIAWEYRLRFS